jgi:transcriptional regulator with XRE-family HTH domain
MSTLLVTELLAAGVERHAALKAALSASGVRQFALAKKLGLSEGQVSKLLAGRKPVDDALAQRIAEAISELSA